MENSSNIHPVCRAIELFGDNEEVDFTKEENVLNCQTILALAKNQIFKLHESSEFQDLRYSLEILKTNLTYAEEKLEKQPKVTKYSEFESKTSSNTSLADLAYLASQVKECQVLLEMNETKAYHENAIQEGKKLLQSTGNGQAILKDFVRLWCDSSLTTPGSYLIRESSTFKHNKDYYFFVLSLRHPQSNEVTHSIIAKDTKTGKWLNPWTQLLVMQFPTESFEKLGDLIKNLFTKFEIETPSPQTPFSREEIEAYLTKKYDTKNSIFGKL